MGQNSVVERIAFAFYSLVQSVGNAGLKGAIEIGKLKNVL